MKSYEELDKKWQELQDSEDSLNEQCSINHKIALGNLGIWGLSLFFTPLKAVNLATTAGLFCYRKFYLEKKVKEHNENTVKTAIETKQYEDQIYFLQKLKKLVDDHYKNIYKGYKYTKEEEICKQLKLNSKEQMDLKITRELKNQVKALYEMNEDNHYNILVLGRSGVGKSTLINVVLDLKGEDAAIENAVKPQIEVNEKGIVKSHSRYTPKEYRSEKSSIVLLDSRGIELSKEYNIDIAMKEIKEFIEERNGIISDPDKFIHCIW